MRYALLIYHDESKVVGTAVGTHRQGDARAMGAYTRSRV